MCSLCIGKTWNVSIFEIEKPAGEGRENDVIVTEAQPRFLLHHSKSRPQGLFSLEDTI